MTKCLYSFSKLLFISYNVFSFTLNSKSIYSRNTKLNVLPSKMIEEIGRNGGKIGDAFSFSEFIRNVEADNIRDVTLIENTNNLIVNQPNRRCIPRPANLVAASCFTWALIA